MDYIALYRLLNQSYDLCESEIHWDQIHVIARNYTFQSKGYGLAKLREDSSISSASPLFSQPDDKIIENKTFRFSIVQKSDEAAVHKKVILMLHGLNERKWAKYLPWAVNLAVNTGVPVILFPISFHMNRSPESWSNPRILLSLVKQKVACAETDEFTSIANYALSERLNQSPERFFLSGYQSINDVVQLVEQLRNKEFGNFDRDLIVDFFAYSIGAFLTEILMISNPKNILDQSKFFFFCGGAVFSGMNATSKYILNKTAQERINRYYLQELETDVVNSKNYRDILNTSDFGQAFRSMITPNQFRSTREKALRRFSSQLKAIGLKKDFVIPPSNIFDTIKGFSKRSTTQFEMLDFNYPYSHESPFDPKLTRFSDAINDSFNQVFLKASTFLSQ